jgi:hypothetical protein
MIKITVELIPFGILNHPRRQILGTATIANTGRGTPTRGEYVAEFCTKNGRKWKTAFVRDFPRKQLLSWDLLYRALRTIIGERNKEN